MGKIYGSIPRQSKLNRWSGVGNESSWGNFPLRWNSCVSVPRDVESLDPKCVYRAHDTLLSIGEALVTFEVACDAVRLANNLETSSGWKEDQEKQPELLTALLFRNWIQWPQMNLVKDHHHHRTIVFSMIFAYKLVKSSEALHGWLSDRFITLEISFSFTLCTARFFLLFAFHSKISLDASKFRVHADQLS